MYKILRQFSFASPLVNVRMLACKEIFVGKACLGQTALAQIFLRLMFRVLFPGTVVAGGRCS